jgi:hypothetical protein
MAVEGYYDDWLFPMSACGLYACPLHMTVRFLCFDSFSLFVRLFVICICFVAFRFVVIIFWVFFLYCLESLVGWAGVWDGGQVSLGGKDALCTSLTRCEILYWVCRLTPLCFLLMDSLAALPVLSAKASQLFGEWRMTRAEGRHRLALTQGKSLLQFSIMGRDYFGNWFPCELSSRIDDMSVLCLYYVWLWSITMKLIFYATLNI